MRVGLRRTIFAVALVWWSLPLAAAPVAIDLPGARAFPESITAGTDGTLYVGSAGEGGVTRILPGGKPERWIAPGADGTRSIFGVLADNLGNRLLVCSNDLSAMGVAGPGTVAGSWLKIFDLTSGRLRKSVRLPGRRTLCNDIAVGADGAAYVTDSLAPHILRLRPEADVLEVWASDPRFAPPPGGGAGLDGIAFTGDGTLYVDTFTDGRLFRIGTKLDQAGAIEEVKSSRPLVRPDALKPFGQRDLLLVEGAGRLDRIAVEGAEMAVDTLKDGLDEPTGVAIARSTAWVAEGQLSHLFGPGQGVPPRQPFRIIPVTLPIR